MIRSSFITVSLLAVVALAAPASATPPAGVLDDHAGAGAVAAAPGLVAWSVWDGTQFRLTVWRAGAATTPPLAGSPLPFDVSAGTGASGRPMLVWPRCSGRQAREACDIVRFDPARPAGGEQPVRFAASARAEETTAALDAGRLAYASTKKGSTMASAIVRRLDGRGPVRTFEVGPRRFGTDLLGPDTAAERTVRRRLITGLALRGGTLAVAGRSMTKDGSPGACGQSFIRLVSLVTGREREVVHATCGMSGASYGPMAFDPRGRLWFVRTCGGDPSACEGRQGAPRRFDPRTGRTTLLATRLRRVAGLAVTGSSLVVDDGPTFPSQTCQTVSAGMAVSVCDRVQVLPASALPR